MPKVNCPCTVCQENVAGLCIAEEIELQWVEIITIEGLGTEVLDCYSKE